MWSKRKFQSGNKNLPIYIFTIAEGCLISAGRKCTFIAGNMRPSQGGGGQFSDLAYARRHINHGLDWAFFDDIGEKLYDFDAIHLPFEPAIWLVLLEFSDLMLDVLYGYLALYFVDVVGFSASKAALAVAVWTGFGLLGDFLLIPLLEKVRGLEYLRLSVLVELVLFPAFLLIPNPWAKLVVVGLLGLFNSGWYAILQGNLYSSMPGQSGAVMALRDIAGLFGKLLPYGIGLAAEHFGLGSALWILLAGPVALLIGLPRRGQPLMDGST